MADVAEASQQLRQVVDIDIAVVIHVAHDIRSDIAEMAQQERQVVDADLAIVVEIDINPAAVAPGQRAAELHAAGAAQVDAVSFAASHGAAELGQPVDCGFWILD